MLQKCESVIFQCEDCVFSDYAAIFQAGTVHLRAGLCLCRL